MRWSRPNRDAGAFPTARASWQTPLVWRCQVGMGLITDKVCFRVVTTKSAAKNNLAFTAEKAYEFGD
jgi:hypothetical protein